MSIKLGNNDISQVSPGSIRLGPSPLDRVYDGTKLVWERGIQTIDTLDSLGSFTQTSSGSGIGITNGEAQWGGSTDGTGTALYNTSALTNNQYVAGIAGSYMHASRASGLIFHCDSSLTTWYGVLFESDRIALLSNTGRWLQNIGGAQDINHGQWNGSVSSGDTLSAWNIGENFFVAQNGTIRISVTISGANIGPTKRLQGIGLYRESFASSCRISQWWGGDAGAWGKI
jgi:hypothetical protein